jgi:hypothetical protein
MTPDERFEDWYNREGVRFWSPSGHEEYLKFAFNSGMEVFRVDFNREKHLNDLWEKGAMIYEGHEESIGNWKMVSDKLLKALDTGDGREAWEAKELYNWAKDRDIELKNETDDR